MIEPTAPVNKIIDHSVVDGPGNRTAIFFQGCNFNCLYCHNPETIGVCSVCGECVAGCPVGALQRREEEILWDETRCCGCDACIKVCPHNASPRVRRMTAPQIAARIEKNRPFIRGITCSGGECTLSAEVMQQLFFLTHRMGLSNLIDSNGSYDFIANSALLELCDGVMLDVKAYDNPAHVALTGQDNRMVLRNAVELARRGKLPEIRTVVIPDALPNEQTVDKITRLLAPYQAMGAIRYKLIRFRPMGVRVSARNFCVPDNALMERLRSLALHNGFSEVVDV
ncbi:MAG: YjjW family glycine radical enzyme activase, partial [Oscillospiraceae bacterium]